LEALASRINKPLSKKIEKLNWSKTASAVLFATAEAVALQFLNNPYHHGHSFSRVTAAKANPTKE
jgi:hypothetical protein